MTENVKVILIGAIIGGIIGAIATGGVTLYISKINEEKEQKNIAQALLIEINGTSSQFSDLANKLSSDQNITWIGVPQTIYDTNGVYFDYRKEIASFDPDLATDLYTYYNCLYMAERDRVLILNIVGFDNSTAHAASIRLRNNLVKASNMVPKLQQELMNGVDV